MSKSVLEKFEEGFKGYHKDAPAYLKSERKKLVAKKMKNGQTELGKKKHLDKKSEKKEFTKMHNMVDNWE